MITIDGTLTIAEVVAVARDRERVELDPTARDAIERSHREVESIVRSDASVYGVTTGLGDLQDEPVSPAELKALQRNLVRSHATTVGTELPVDVVRASLLVRANALAHGLSGVSPALVERLLAFLNEGIHPVIPIEGSTDDLGAAAHIGLALIGDGTVTVDGEKRDAAEALEQAGLDGYELRPKEGLAIASGTPIMTALAALGVSDAQRLVRTADLAAGWTFALVGHSPSAFDERVFEARPYDGQRTTARNVRALLPEDGSRSYTTQDPLSLRCIPQVHGTVRDALSFVHQTITTELQSATDNPLIYPDGTVLSCGNFNGQPISSAVDLLSSTLAKLGRMSERRTNALVTADDGSAFLADDPGVESGMMIAHYSAAGLAADITGEQRISERSAIVSGGQEDVHSMGTLAARRLTSTIEQLERIVAIELLCAARRSLLDAEPTLSPPLESAAATLETAVGVPRGDEPLTERIRRTADLIRDEELLDAVADTDIRLR
ncbi:HAL/PAL/TAL family ammonia-lyase [Natrinema sp. LN54]|uniref:HAL/PAL/TAL family ammonia-lyase n=1 Tax=Natrinema sp. LN54 TaxID=3458705 RepID=UPI004035CF26